MALVTGPIETTRAAAVGTVERDGRFTTVQSWPAGTFGLWTHIVWHDGSLFFYDANTGNGAIGRLEGDPPQFKNYHTYYGGFVAGGAFSMAGGVPANNVARFDGSSWWPLGAGVDDAVYSLLVHEDGGLIVGGKFLNAGGAPADRIARWDGAAWTSLGATWTQTGFGQEVGVRALAPLPNGDVLAAAFNFAQWSPGQPLSRLQRWDAPVILGVRFLPGLSLGGLLAAGLYGVPIARFMALNAIAALGWAAAYGSFGYLLGRAIPHVLSEIEHYERPVALLLLAATLVWIAVVQFRRWRRGGATDHG